MLERCLLLGSVGWQKVARSEEGSGVFCMDVDPFGVELPSVPSCDVERDTGGGLILRLQLEGYLGIHRRTAYLQGILAMQYDQVHLLRGKMGTSTCMGYLFP